MSGFGIAVKHPSGDISEKALGSFQYISTSLRHWLVDPMGNKRTGKKSGLKPALQVSR